MRVLRPWCPCSPASRRWVSRRLGIEVQRKLVTREELEVMIAVRPDGSAPGSESPARPLARPPT